MKLHFYILSLIAFAACAQTTDKAAPSEIVEESLCQTEVFRVDSDFSAANMNSCNIIDARTIEIFLKPEDTPINASPWYAVRLTPFEAGDVKLVLRYEEHPHRYKPKLSYDGVSWTVLPRDRVDSQATGFRVTLDLTLGDQQLFVSAQELFTNEAHQAWVDEQSQKAFVNKSQIGESIEGRPIEMIRTRAVADQAKTVLLVGRQHPPEVTGALAMTHFSEELLGSSDLAKRFRDKFDLIIIPNINPDGVERGHWRHNMAGMDLNRDWGPFTQPETQAVKVIIDQIADPGLAVFLDFHSTRRNVFYTQPVGRDGTEYGFTARWLARARSKLSAYEFDRKGAHNVDLPTSKTYIYARFGIPAITYELGDETDRSEIKISAQVFAREFMTLLLERE